MRNLLIILEIPAIPFYALAVGFFSCFIYFSCSGFQFIHIPIAKNNINVIFMRFNKDDKFIIYFLFSVCPLITSHIFMVFYKVNYWFRLEWDEFVFNWKFIIFLKYISNTTSTTAATTTKRPTLLHLLVCIFLIIKSNA